jgi:hypothetical protein
MDPMMQKVINRRLDRTHLSQYERGFGASAGIAIIVGVGKQAVKRREAQQ